MSIANSGNSGSVTQWIGKLDSSRSEEAVSFLCQRYFHRLACVAANNLNGLSNADADEEDVAQEAFYSFCVRAMDGRLPGVRHRDELWKLLVTITVRKAVNQRKYKMAGKRDCRKQQQLVDDELLLSTEPSPELVAQLEDEIGRQLSALPSDLRTVAGYKLQGYDNVQIAEEIGTSVRTVERKLKCLRTLWSEAHDDDL